MARPLVLLLVLSGLLAVGYAWVTPVGAAPDESAHLQYVQALVATGRLPVLDMAHREQVGLSDEAYEAHQPPFYYALCAPFYALGRQVAGNRGAGEACRAVSIVLSLLGVVAIWLLAREVVPDRPPVWLAASAIAAFLPMRLHLAASVSNDSLAELTSTLALLAMVRLLRPSAGVREASLLGLALAAALLAKQNAILLFPPALLALYLPYRGHVGTSDDVAIAEAQRRMLRQAGAVAAVVIVLCGWWYARNMALYGDPLAQRVFNDYFADTPRWADFRDQLHEPYAHYWTARVLPVAFDSFWGAFGHLDPTRPDLFMGAYGEGPPGRRWGYPPHSWLYPLLAVATLLTLAGGVRYYLRQRGKDAGDRTPALLLAVHALFVLAAFLNFNSTYYQAQGRYFAPALGALALGLAGGWLEWTRGSKNPRREAWAAYGVAGALAALATYALFGVLLPGFSTP